MELVSRLVLVQEDSLCIGTVPEGELQLQSEFLALICYITHFVSKPVPQMNLEQTSEMPHPCNELINQTERNIALLVYGGSSVVSVDH